LMKKEREGCNLAPILIEEKKKSQEGKESTLFLPLGREEGIEVRSYTSPLPMRKKGKKRHPKKREKNAISASTNVEEWGKE